VATGGSIPPDVLAERLLLAIYAYGTNTGIKAVAAGGHGHSEDDIRYVRRRYLTAEAARAIAIGIANATFAARSTELWVAAVTGCWVAGCGWRGPVPWRVFRTATSSTNGAARPGRCPRTASAWRV